MWVPNCASDCGDRPSDLMIGEHYSLAKVAKASISSVLQPAELAEMAQPYRPNRSQPASRRPQATFGKTSGCAGLCCDTTPQT